MITDEDRAAAFKRYARENGWRVRRGGPATGATVFRRVEQVTVSWAEGKWSDGDYRIKGGLIRRLKSAASARQVLFEKPARLDPLVPRRR